MSQPDLSDVPTEAVTTATTQKTPAPKMRKEVVLANMKPVVAAVLNEALKIFNTSKTDYELAEEFIDTDPVVGGNADALAMLVQKAYRGPRIKLHPDEEESSAASKLKNPAVNKIALGRAKADEVLYDIDFKGILFSCAVNLFQDGDVVIWVRGKSFTFLPRRMVTALPAKYIKVSGTGENTTYKTVWHEKMGAEKKNKQEAKLDTIPHSHMASEILMSADYYILNENNASEVVIPKEQIIHVKMNPYGRTVVDQQGRTTFNLWSPPPLKRLKKTLLWKANAIVNDILWRDSMPPREHHKIDLSLFSPDNYDGDTPEERVTAARAAALAMIDQYIANISHKEVDVGYVTDLITEINVIESRSHNYADPNALLKQLDEDVHATSGVPRGAMRGEGGGAYASELLTSNYAGLRAEFIGDRIARPFEDWLKDYMKGTMSQAIGSKVIDRIRLKFRLILPRDVREIAQAVNLLAESMIVDIAQILEIVGLDTMPKEEFAKHLKQMKEINDAKAPKMMGMGGQPNDKKKSTKDDDKSVSRQKETPATNASKQGSPKQP